MFKKILAKITDLLEIVKVKSVNNKENKITIASTDDLIKDGVFIQHYGFASYPPVDTKAVAFNVGSDISNTIVFSTDGANYYDGSLSVSDVCIYDANNNVIKLTNKGIFIESSNAITFNNDVKINGKLTASDDVVASSISLKNHTHNVPGGISLTPNPSLNL